MALGSNQKQGAMQRGYNQVTIRDDKKLYFGDDWDVSLEYDEDGNDVLSIDGGDVLVEDDHKLYFGSGKDGYITYDEAGAVASDVFGLAAGTNGFALAIKSGLADGDSGFVAGCIGIDLASGAVYVNVSDSSTAKWSGLL